MDKRKDELAKIIDSHRDEILKAGQNILEHPELGFKEIHTKEMTESWFDRYGIPYTAGHGVTGVKGCIKGGESRINICLMGEMDAVKCISHPNADLSTGAAHASTPFDGVNALNAAMVTLMAIHANRDTFREKDRVRVHPIITNGGDIVNTVPGRVTIETYVRAANAKAIVNTAKIVDNCVNAGALSLGAKASIHNQSGYLPLVQDHGLTKVLEDNARLLMPEAAILRGVDMVGSTDAGDLSCLIPCIQPTLGGFQGTIHGNDFYSCKPEFNVVTATKLLCFTIVDLLCDQAKAAERIKKQFEARFTKDEYLQYLTHSF